MKPPLLVIGGDGLIGSALTNRLRIRGAEVIATTRSQSKISTGSIHFDLSTDPLPALPAGDAAVICAAVTRQDQCRQNPAATRQVNVVQTLRLIRQLLERNSFVVFLSTNLVFDGRRPMRKPDEPLSPKTEYGRQKAEVERALGEWPHRVAIVRLTKVVPPGLPLLEKWRDELTAGRPVNAFSDYFCSPVSLETVVDGISQIATGHRSGIWQFSGPADVSYAGLAREVAKFCGADAALVKATLAPAGMMEDLPSHTTLDATRACDELGLRFSEAPDVLASSFGTV